jgi:hypothetical protein
LTKNVHWPKTSIDQKRPLTKNVNLSVSKRQPFSLKTSTFQSQNVNLLDSKRQPARLQTSTC